MAVHRVRSISLASLAVRWNGRVPVSTGASGPWASMRVASSLMCRVVVIGVAAVGVVALDGVGWVVRMSAPMP
ncbi:hypothetical protein BJF79_31195 [Actinomadura sp. CNU-125]|nr:hypothetical protein BJF79_31195 [Actinomadura sp. CNU-125]